MGNLASALNEHSIGEQIASGGPQNIWKIYDAKRRATNENVALFVFDKAILEKYPSAVRESVLETLRNEIKHLTKLRHPRILSILRSEQETKKAIIIETEPLFGSLANVLRDYTNLKPSHALTEFELEPIEIKIGVMQIAEALDFLHNNANIIHRNITPSSIYLTRKGEWKLAGFNFSSFTNYKPGIGKTMTIKEFNAKKETFQTQPDFDYLAPEYIYTKQYDYSSDMFSLGCVLFQIYAKQKLFNNQNNILNYKQNIENINNLLQASNSLPYELQDAIRKLVTVNPKSRIDAKQFIGSEYFNDISIQSIVFLSTLLEIDNSKKAAFFKGFFTVVGNFTPRIIESKILPPILQELKNEIQIPFLLPIIMELSKPLIPRKFQTMIFPHILPLLQAYESPNNAFLFSNLSMILSKLSPTLFEQKIMPIISAMIESPNARIQDLIIRQIPEIYTQIDYSIIKGKFLPRLVNLITGGMTNTTVRVNSLVCFNKLIPSLDKGTILELILPALEFLIKSEPSTTFLLPILHCYSALNLQLGPQLSCSRLLPFLVPMCCSTELQQEQFVTLMSLIKTILKSIEDWRLAEFRARKEVEQHLEEKNEEQFITHKNFESLVNSEFEEQTKKKITSPPTRPITNELPPSSESMNSFNELIEQEQAARNRPIKNNSAAPNPSNDNLKSIQFSANSENLAAFDFPSEVDSFNNTSFELPPPTRANNPSPVVAPVNPLKNMISSTSHSNTPSPPPSIDNWLQPSSSITPSSLPSSQFNPTQNNSNHQSSFSSQSQSLSLLQPTSQPTSLQPAPQPNSLLQPTSQSQNLSNSLLQASPHSSMSQSSSLLQPSGKPSSSVLQPNSPLQPTSQSNSLLQPTSQSNSLLQPTSQNSFPHPSQSNSLLQATNSLIQPSSQSTFIKPNPTASPSVQQSAHPMQTPVQPSNNQPTFPAFGQNAPLSAPPTAYPPISPSFSTGSPVVQPNSQSSLQPTALPTQLSQSFFSQSSSLTPSSQLNSLQHQTTPTLLPVSQQTSNFTTFDAVPQSTTNTSFNQQPSPNFMSPGTNSFNFDSFTSSNMQQSGTSANQQPKQFTDEPSTFTFVDPNATSTFHFDSFVEPPQTQKQPEFNFGSFTSDPQSTNDWNTNSFSPSAFFN